MYLEKQERAEYARFYEAMAEDDEIMAIAEEGMGDYYEQLKEYF